VVKGDAPTAAAAAAAQADREEEAIGEAIALVAEAVRLVDLASSARAEEAAVRCFIYLEFRCRPINIAREEFSLRSRLGRGVPRY